MKKLVKIFGIIFALLILALILVPFLFKGQITDLVKEEANKNLNATVNFGDVGLNLFSSFPNLSFSLGDLSVVNKAPFEGDTIFSSSNFNLTIDLMSIISGDKIKVKSINLDNPKILIYILKDGSNNYNIFPETEVKSKTEGEVNTDKSISMSINSYSINNGKIAYVDQTSNMIVALNGLNHKGIGDFNKENFLLETETSIREFTVEMNNVKYLNRVNTNVILDVEVNAKDNKFLLKNNQLKINNLTLNLDGNAELQNDELFVDFKFNSPKTDFKDILSLIPAIYKNDFSTLSANGNVDLNGMIKGKMSETQNPAFNFNINVANANFKYPDLPSAINNVSINLDVNNSDGNPNSTILDLKKIHFELDKEPFDAKLKITDLEKNPYVNATVKGIVNLNNYKKVLQLENVTELGGIIKADFSFNGNLTTENSNYENLDASGNLSLSNIIYKSTKLPEGINISNSDLKFTPKKVELNNFSAKIGENDIQANGDLNNFISFVLSDATLIGKLNVTSNNFNVNPYLNDDKTTAIDIPKNINFNLSSTIKNLTFDNLDIKNFISRLIIKDSKVTMEDLSMNLLNGTLKGNGYYAKSVEQENPEIEFNLNISNFNINETYNKFATVKMFAPIAKYIQGSFSSGLSLKSNLDNDLLPVWNSFNSNGQLSMPILEIKDFKPFTTLGSLLNLNELSNPKIQNVNPKFKIENGKFSVAPISYKVGNYDVTFSGSNSIDQTIDYVMEIDVPSGNLKNSANSAISNLLKKDLSVIKSDKIKIKALIGGTIDSPTIKTSASDIAKEIVADVVQEVKEKVVEEVKAKIDSVKIQAEKKIEEETKKKEEEIKKKLEEEAKKKLKKIFKFG